VSSSILSSTAPAKSGRDSFGARLRAQRERAGVTLEAIAEETKVRRSLLVELENNNLSHWPDGLFRRAFFREYLSAIGIESEAVVAEFVRLFPESGEPPAASVDGADGLDSFGGELRLQLAPSRFSALRCFLLQSAASAADLSLVAALVACAVWLLGVPVWPTTAVVGLIYYGLSAAALGRTPALWLSFSDRFARRRSAARARASDKRLLRIVARHKELVQAPAANDEEDIPSQRHAVSR
jgi:transcriptional regulator with XRE-family HTH domain